MREFLRYMVSALIVFTVIMAPAAPAQDSDQSLILIYPHNLDDRGPNEYNAIVSGFIAVELLSEGFSAEASETALDLELDDGMPGIDALSPLIEYGEEGGYEFVILCAFSEIGPDIELFIHFIDVDAGEIALSLEKQKQPILTIDSALFQSVDLIVEKLGDRMYVEPAARPTEEMEIGHEAVVTRKEVIIPVAPPVQLSNVPVKGFAASVGVGAIVFLGSAADNLRPGLTATVSGKYGLPLLSGRFDLGLYAGGAFVEPQEAITDGNLIISPAGILLGFTSATGSFLDVSFSLCAGMSIFAARIEQQPYLVKNVPFIAGGPGFIAFANSRMSVQIDVLMNVFFEGQEVIFSYVPNLSILLR